MTDNELLLAISNMLDTKLQPLKDDITSVKLDIENTVKPHIRLLSENYIPAAKRFESVSNKIEAIQDDLILERV